MMEILYATGYNKEKKKRIRRDYCPGYSILIFFKVCLLDAERKALRPDGHTQAYTHLFRSEQRSH